MQELWISTVMPLACTAGQRHLTQLTNKAGQTPLAMAKALGKEEAAKALREPGIGRAAILIPPAPQTEPVWARGALLAAARQGDVKQMQSLLARGVPVNQSDEEGMTPLHAAAEAGHVGAIKALIEAGEGRGCRKGTVGRVACPWPFRRWVCFMF